MDSKSKTRTEYHVIDGRRRAPAGFIGAYATREEAHAARRERCRMGGYIVRVRYTDGVAQ